MRALFTRLRGPGKQQQRLAACPSNERSTIPWLEVEYLHFILCVHSERTGAFVASLTSCESLYRRRSRKLAEFCDSLETSAKLINSYFSVFALN